MRTPVQSFFRRCSTGKPTELPGLRSIRAYRGGRKKKNSHINLTTQLAKLCLANRHRQLGFGFFLIIDPCSSASPLPSVIPPLPSCPPRCATFAGTWPIRPYFCLPLRVLFSLRLSFSATCNKCSVSGPLQPFPPLHLSLPVGSSSLKPLELPPLLPLQLPQIQLRQHGQLPPHTRAFFGSHLQEPCTPPALCNSWSSCNVPGLPLASGGLF
ncbi:hypothetical protein V8C37DRAFT_277936 [Trichoderma ceciliae]